MKSQKLKGYFTSWVKTTKNFRYFWQKMGLMLLLGLMLFLFFFTIIFSVTLIIIHLCAPEKYQLILLHLHVFPTHTVASFLPTNLLDDAVRAMEAVLYVIFIKPILWLLNQVSIVINFLGSGTVSQKVLFHNNTGFWNVPKEFWVILFIAIAIIALLLAVKLIVIMYSHYEKQGFMFRSALINTVGAIMIMLIIPAVFMGINFIIITITEFIISNSGPKKINLGLWIFNASFNNGMHHFSSVPATFNFTDARKFNYIVCLFGEGFMVYILFVIALNLFTRVFELLILYCTAPLVISSIVTDTTGQYKIFKNWIDVTLQRFVLFFFIFLAYNTFLNSISLFAEVAQLIPTTTTRPVFVLVGILGAGVVVVKAPQMLNSIIGGEASILDSLGHITSTVVATKTIASGLRWGTQGAIKVVRATDPAVQAATSTLLASPLVGSHLVKPWSRKSFQKTQQQYDKTKKRFDNFMRQVHHNKRKS